MDFLNLDLIRKEPVLLERWKAHGITAEELKK